MATPPPPPATSSVETVEEHVEEQGQRLHNQHIIIPEDGYEWKKYGQKFIKNTQRVRSYFRCRNKGCQAKKKVEWPPSNPSNVRVVYDGVHDHPSPRPQSASEQDAAALTANQYNLATQVFGQPTNTS